MTELEMEYPQAQFETEMPESAWARLPDEFEMAMEELLRNAIEHSDGDEPQIRVTVDQPNSEDGTISIAVEDDGPGIPDHKIDVLSSDEETPLAHSEGIGLWMVTWIINAADGDVTFEESSMGGSVVRLEFSKAEPPALTLSM